MSTSDRGGIQALLVAEQDAQQIVANARSAKFNGFVAPSLTMTEITFMLDSGVADGIVSFVISLLRPSRAHGQGVLDYAAVSRISCALYLFSTVLSLDNANLKLQLREGSHVCRR